MTLDFNLSATATVTVESRDNEFDIVDCEGISFDDANEWLDATIAGVRQAFKQRMDAERYDRHCADQLYDSLPD